MDYLGLILSLLGALLSTQLVKTLVLKAAQLVNKEISALSPTFKLVLGASVGFVFAVLVQAGTIPLPGDRNTTLPPIVFTAVAKAVYDLINDIINKAKPQPPVA